MIIDKKEDHVVFHLPERIDSNNVTAFEKEAMEAVGEYKEWELVMDAGKLSYISSAGLRVLLRMQKQKS